MWGRNFVLLALSRYHEIEKGLRNVRCLEKIGRVFRQHYAGGGVKHEWNLPGSADGAASVLSMGVL